MSENKEKNIEIIQSLVKKAKFLPTRDKKSLDQFLQDTQKKISLLYTEEHPALNEIKSAQFLPASFYASTKDYRVSWYNGINQVLKVFQTLLKELDVSLEDQDLFISDDQEDSISEIKKEEEQKPIEEETNQLSRENSKSEPVNPLKLLNNIETKVFPPIKDIQKKNEPPLIKPTKAQIPKKNSSQKKPQQFKKNSQKALEGLMEGVGIMLAWGKQIKDKVKSLKGARKEKKKELSIKEKQKEELRIAKMKYLQAQKLEKLQRREDKINEKNRLSLKKQRLIQVKKDQITAKEKEKNELEKLRLKIKQEEKNEKLRIKNQRKQFQQISQIKNFEEKNNEETHAPSSKETITAQEDKNENTKFIPKKKILLICRNENDISQTVLSTLAEWNLQGVILKNDEVHSQSIYEKYEKNQNTPFAIVLLYADDWVYAKDEKPADAVMHAHQSMVFQLGFWLAKLHQQNVFILHYNQKRFRLPSEFIDAIYTPFDKNELWKKDLKVRLEESGLLKKLAKPQTKEEDEQPVEDPVAA